MAKGPTPPARKPAQQPAKAAATKAPAKAAPAQAAKQATAPARAPAKAAPAPEPKKAPAAQQTRQAAPAQQQQQRSNVPATRTGTAVAKVDPNTAMMMEDEGLGHSDFETKDLSIPFVRILQSNSPQVNKRGDGYIEGCEPGHIFNTALEKPYDGETGVYVIVCKYQRKYTEWKLRTEGENGTGGGFVQDHGTDDSIMKKTQQKTMSSGSKKNILPNGNEVVESADYFVIMFDPTDGSMQKAVISMASTQWKAARKLNNQISGWSEPRPDGKGTFNPPPYGRVYLFSTVPQSNDKGDFFGWKIEPGDKTTDLEGGRDLYLMARDFRKSVEGGHERAAAPAVADADEPGAVEEDDDQGDFSGGQEEPAADEPEMTEEENDDDQAPHAGGEDDDDIPFD